MISYDDFLKVDIRVGKIIEVLEFKEAIKPAFKLKIDFGSEIGIKNSSGQFPKEHTREEILGKLVICVVNFPKKKIAGFESEVLTLGLPGPNGGWVIVSPIKDVEIGLRLA